MFRRRGNGIHLYDAGIVGSIGLRRGLHDFVDEVPGRPADEVVIGRRPDADRRMSGRVRGFERRVQPISRPKHCDSLLGVRTQGMETAGEEPAGVPPAAGIEQLREHIEGVGHTSTSVHGEPLGEVRRRIEIQLRHMLLEVRPPAGHDAVVEGGEQFRRVVIAVEIAESEGEVETAGSSRQFRTLQVSKAKLRWFDDDIESSDREPVVSPTAVFPAEIESPVGYEGRLRTPAKFPALRSFRSAATGIPVRCAEPERAAFRHGGGYSDRYPGPRSTRPGRASVGRVSAMTATPFTKTHSMPMG